MTEHEWMIRKIIFSWGVQKDDPLYDDLYQEGLIAIDKAIKTYDPSRCDKIEGWVYINIRSAIHRYYKYHSHKNEQEIKLYKLEENTTPEDYTSVMNCLEHFSEILNEMPQRDQRIFLNHVMEGKTMTSIAKEENLAVGTIHQIVKKIKLKMRKVLES